MSQPYYMPKPVEPSRDWVGRLMSASLIVSVVGLAIYGLFAFAFGDVKVIPSAVQSWLVVIGSALIVTGAEMNTPAALVAVARKIGRKQQHWLDYVILAVSVIGGIAGVLIVFSSRQSALGENGWRAWALSWGPLFVGITVVLDYAGTSVELGLLRSEYDAEMSEWLEAEQEWNETHGIEAEQPVSEPWPTAGVRDFRALLQSMNGERAALTKENLEAHFAKVGLAMPAPSTVDRWWREEM